MSTTLHTVVDDNPHYDPEYGLAPRALRYAEKANAAEQLIVDALGDIIAKLVSMAREGDVPAARYLCDRIYGRVARRALPAIDDKALPYNQRDWGRAKFDDTRKREEFVRQCVKPVANPFDDLFKSSIPGVGSILRNIDPLFEAVRKEQARQKRT